MKNLAFIGGPILLVAVCAIVLWANMPRAKLQVRAVTPLFTTVASRPDRPLEIWEAAATNVGRASARWFAYVRFKDGNHEWSEYAGVFGVPNGILATGTLRPGESATFQFATPLTSPTNWTVAVKYSAITSTVETKLYNWLKPVPKLRRILPNSGEHFASDVWHQGTNVDTVR